MEPSTTLDAIFPSIRVGVLSSLLLESERWWFLSELARHLEVRPSSLQRELDSLVGAGILARREDGRRVYFKANTGSPIFNDLRGLMEKTVGLVPALSKALATLGRRIDVALLYGSLARGEGRSTSDVDVLIVGSVQQIDLVPILRKLEGRFGREVNVTLYSLQEFTNRLSAGDHFLSSVMKGRTILLKGSIDELDKAPAGRKGSPSRNQQE